MKSKMAESHNFIEGEMLWCFVLISFDVFKVKQFCFVLVSSFKIKKLSGAGEMTQGLKTRCYFCRGHRFSSEHLQFQGFLCLPSVSAGTGRLYGAQTYTQAKYPYAYSKSLKRNFIEIYFCTPLARAHGF